jgi:hypothetical protein
LSAFYESIKPIGEPSDELGLDTQNRRRWFFNVEIVKGTSTDDDLGRELAEILELAGVVTIGTDITIGPGARVPDGAGPFLNIVLGAGAAPLLIQNQTLPERRRPSAQIVTRAETTAAARSMCFDAYNALAGVRNETVTTP